MQRSPNFGPAKPRPSSFSKCNEALSRLRRNLSSTPLKHSPPALTSSNSSAAGSKKSQPAPQLGATNEHHQTNNSLRYVGLRRSWRRSSRGPRPRTRSRGGFASLRANHVNERNDSKSRGADRGSQRQ